MHLTKKTIRQPDRYRELISAKCNRKWRKIIALFLQKRINELALNHKTGTRGRIFEFLALELFQEKQIHYKSEPIFNHIEPNSWYINFTEQHNIKLRKHDFYNPDMFLEDGTWVEITLSENTPEKLEVYNYLKLLKNIKNKIL